MNRTQSAEGPSAVRDDLEPELRRLRRAFMFFAACAAVFAAAVLIGVFH